MKNGQSNNSNNQSGEHQEPALAVEAVQVGGERQRLDQLVEAGFAWEEAVRLTGMREHLYENAEMKQRIADNAHIQFVQWLYERGELNEE
ncbi:MAG: hypothetical protein H0U76_03330 [Ktedonobacteraceae bacterium]|nr:hypothetical protein [Ktedonobacteraceae bacterium]